MADLFLSMLRCAEALQRPLDKALMVAFSFLRQI
jgi:hypothetical protein